MASSPANSHGNGYPLGLAGSVSATRYVGGTATVAPTTGTFLVGDFVISQNGKLWVCTVAGTPGTWTQIGGAPSGAAGGELTGTYPSPNVGAARSPYGNLGFLSTRYYNNDVPSTLGGTPMTEALLSASPFRVRKTTTFDRIAVYQAGAGTAGALVRLGIYADSGNCYPGTLILDAGTYPADVAGAAAKEITISQSLTAGLVWVAAASQGTPVTPSTVYTATGGANNAHWQALSSEGFNPGGYSQSAVSGALPDPFSSTLATPATTPVIWLRAA